ncbi:MAG: hypothetical protein AAFQ94_09735 [Bacteroidota bacterium]
MKNQLMLLTLITLTILTSCTEDIPEAVELNGTYEGTFTVEYLLGGDTFSNPVTLNFSDGSFSSSSGENRFPAGGSGTFDINNNSVTFEDENFWTADFDWGLILDGEYTISETATSIVIRSSANDAAIYTYELIK